MSIEYIREKIKSKYAQLWPYAPDIAIVLIVVLTASLSFGLGRSSASNDNEAPIEIVKNCPNSLIAPGANDQIETPGTNPEAANTNLNSKSLTGSVFASKKGSRYYYPWCRGGSRIKEINKVTFNSKEEAEAAGYTLASGCK